jgi:hypothetical protein
MRTAGTNATLIEAVESAFHTTNHGDQTIADNITAQGIPTTRKQVEEIRLKNGWRRRANNEDQLAEMRAETFALTKQALHEGVVRCYGRGLLRTYLHIKYRHNAREDDVRDAIATLDIPGTESRRKGPDKGRKGGELSHPGPTGYGAVMVTINSGTTVLRSTPASMPIQGASSGVMLVIAIAELSVSSDRLLRQSRSTADVLLSSDLTEARRFYSSPTPNSVYIFFTKGQLEWPMPQKIP